MLRESIAVSFSVLIIFVAPAYAQNQTQTQGWSTYEDPILGIRFEHPSWWEKTEDETTIKLSPAPTLFAGVQYFLPPLPEEMNTTEKFMRYVMSLLRSTYTQNTSVNKTSTVGMDNIPAYKVESESISEAPSTYRNKSIRYFFIDNSTGTGYQIFLNTDMDRLQEDVPLFEKMVDSFKIQ